MDAGHAAAANAPLTASFAACPAVDVPIGMSPESFWDEFSEDPRPLVIKGGARFDLWSEAPATFNGGRQFGDGELTVNNSSTPYILTNSGYTPRVLELVSKRFPLPAVTQVVSQRPVLSIGLNGTGEIDLAHHYHPVTAMLLLQGQKIWALRPPGDNECMFARGTCTDPFNVCAYYARLGAPSPACVQVPGDTIIVPDGWYHGTCNNASVTVGWGGQGRYLRLRPPRSSPNSDGEECAMGGSGDSGDSGGNDSVQGGGMSYGEGDEDGGSNSGMMGGGAAGRGGGSRDANNHFLTTQHHFSSTSEPLLGIASITALRQRLESQALQQSFETLPLEYMGPAAAQASSMAIRSLVRQFVVQTFAQHERILPSERQPICLVLKLLHNTLPPERFEWLTSPEHVSIYVHVQGLPVTLTFRSRTGEREFRSVAARHAAIWLGDSLVSFAREEGNGGDDGSESARDDGGGTKDGEGAALSAGACCQVTCGYRDERGGSNAVCLLFVPIML
eukprot:CAMPEP_0119326364 /NCGR_PEP_ID=MMETSP1333-20130426/68211_1 /TAXON_ID=418940 /ORGANISM="Scyphosphaera apsteinii, Strain RCC1455" /LENGTH=503 /DNA_ID=CAMNT_0007334657 /DNA_START=363 /DNA_END=1875 /DNA_ORIENTATION=+